MCTLSTSKFRSKLYREIVQLISTEDSVRTFLLNRNRLKQTMNFLLFSDCPRYLYCF